MSEEKKPVKLGRDTINKSAENLNEYIRVGSIGGFLLIAGLVILAAALIVWGFTGRIPVTTTQTGIVVDTKEESHSCICFLDVDENTGIIQEGTAASIKMADGSVYQGIVDYSGEYPFSAEEIHKMYGPESNAVFQMSDWMFSKLLKNGRYYYMIRIHTEDNIAGYWHQLTATTIVMRQVRPVSYLMR